MRRRSEAEKRRPEGPIVPLPSANGDLVRATSAAEQTRGTPLWAEPAVELSSRRTGMSFQRTRLSADRTLMSVIRTSLSLISFGFTIFQLFRAFYDQGVLTRADAPRNFGLALVSLGILMLVVGIIYHLQFMYGLRAERSDMAAAGLIHAESRFPASFTLITAFVLLTIGVTAIVSMIFQIGTS